MATENIIMAMVKAGGNRQVCNSDPTCTEGHPRCVPRPPCALRLTPGVYPGLHIH